MTNFYRRVDLFKIKNFSPDTLNAAKTPSRISTAKLLNNIQNETMKMHNVRPAVQHQKSLRERVKGLLNKSKLSSLVTSRKSKKKIEVVEGYSPPNSKGGYNSRKYKYTNITKQPKKPNILKKQSRKTYKIKA